MLRSIALRLGRVQGRLGSRLVQDRSFSTSSATRSNDFFDGHQDTSPPPPRRSAYAQRAERDAPPRSAWKDRQSNQGSSKGQSRAKFGLRRNDSSTNGESSSNPMSERASRTFDDLAPKSFGNTRRPSGNTGYNSDYPSRSRDTYGESSRRYDNERPSGSTVRRDQIRNAHEGTWNRNARPQEGPYEARKSKEPLRMSILGRRDESSSPPDPLPQVETVDPADNSSSSTAIATTSQSRISPEHGELDVFFAGHNENVNQPTMEEPDNPVRPAKPFAPSALASYTPPRESGVALIKKYFLEHKFLTTQEIWKMGTSHLKPPLREAHALLPDGRIRMKRVATMREGRRPWVPPMEASFPDHPFRSVRFLKETILASLENAEVIHKTNIHKPLDTEEDHQEAIRAAESQNRKAERRATFKGLPTPAMKAPATTKVVWGWMLGPPFRPKMWEEEREALKAERKAKTRSEWADFKERPRGTSFVPVPPTWEGGKIKEAIQRQEAGELDSPPHLEGQETFMDTFSETESDRPRRQSWGEYKEDHARQGVQPAEEYEDDPVSAVSATETDPNLIPSDYSGKYIPENERSPVVAEEPSSDPGPRTMDELHSKEDWKVDHNRWNWCANQEFAYHKAKIQEAEATAERQFIRRTRLREQREEMKRQMEEDERTGLAEELRKERRRLESLEHIEYYAKTTGQDVSGWFDEVGGELGELPKYAPRAQTRGGAIPRNPKNPRSKFKPFGFPIN